MIQDIGEGVFSNVFSLATAKEDDFLFCYCGGDILLKESNGDYELPLVSDLKPKCHHMFSLDGKGCYISEEIIHAPAGFTYVNARSLMFNKNNKLAFSVCTGLQLYRWEQSRKFCGCCGTPTERSKTERAMVCPKCGQIEYPKICPATITAITHKGRLLMVRNKTSPQGRYGLVAGFCEIGETFEDTVRREAMEEVGIKVKNVTYYKNQPWGITDSQMIGYFAELDGEDDDTLSIQEDEIADARWFAPEEVTKPTNDASVFSELVWIFLNENGIQK